MRRASLILLFVLAPALNIEAWGQSGPVATESLPMRVGLEAGISLCFQKGEFLMHNGVHRFGDGNGTGYAAEAVFDFPLSGGGDPFIVFEGAAGYRRTVIEPRHRRWDTFSVFMSSPRGIDTIAAPVEFEEIANVNFTYLAFAPSIKIYPFKWLYAGLGMDAGILLSAKRDLTRNIMTRVVDINGYGLAEIHFPPAESPDQYSKTVSEDPLHDASSLVLNGRLYVGAEFEVGDGLWISPRVLYSYPFTVALQGSTLSIHSMQFGAGFRYAL